PALSTTKFRHFLRICRDNYPVEDARIRGGLIDPCQQRLASNLSQHLARQTGRCKPGRNHPDHRRAELRMHTPQSKRQANTEQWPSRRSGEPLYNILAVELDSSAPVACDACPSASSSGTVLTWRRSSDG